MVGGWVGGGVGGVSWEEMGQGLLEEEQASSVDPYLMEIPQK